MTHPAIEALLAAGYTEDATGTRHPLQPDAIAPADGELIGRIVRASGARRTLEVGMAWGLSTLYICEALAANGGERHIAVDPNQTSDYHGCGVLNAQRAGFGELVHCIERPSFEALPQLLKDGEQFDLVFIDGNHRFDYTLVDFFYAQRLVRVGGLVLLHDPWLQAIRKVVTCIFRNDPSMHLVSDYALPRAGMLGGLVTALGFLAADPFDPWIARFFARNRFPNLIVFRKAVEMSKADEARIWDLYKSF